MKSELSDLTASPQRLQYRKVVDGSLLFVIVELCADGRAEFWSRDAWEVRWYPFLPSQDEYTAALSLVGRAGNGGDWPLLR